ncbi:MAG: sensor histidine kinase [Candidatus Flexifilum sp.]|jgi:signal transduction histidine kinase
MIANRGLNMQAVLDGLGQCVLLFDSSNRLVLENQAARTLFGADLKMLRAEGWSAAVLLFKLHHDDLDKSLDAVRARALEGDRPIRFRAQINGEFMPCWAAAVHGSAGEVYTMLSIDLPDWTALTDLVTQYLNEVRDAVDTTRGHIDLIAQTVRSPKKTDTIETVGKKIGGFTHIVDIHMHRLGILTGQIERYAVIRTNRLRDQVRRSQRKLRLHDFVADFLDTLDDDMLTDPETEMHDQRRRIKTAVPLSLLVYASPYHLSIVLRDILRNAIMYSMKATPVEVIAHASPGDQMAQIDIIDEGYGIRASEADRVFAPFMRARQPQIIGEFGYGLSLYLCKQEIEAMGGRIWFSSEENVGTTFSIKLPLWRDDADGSAAIPGR